MHGGCPGPSTLNTGDYYVKGNSVVTLPKAGTFGTMGRNTFRDRPYFRRSCPTV